MSDESDKTPEPSAETESEGPFQFSILHLMILTAAVAVFFAWVTQAPREATLFAVAILLLLFLAIQGLKNVK